MRDTTTREINIRTSNYQGLFVDTSSRKVFVNDVPVRLTRIEYEILLLLVQNKNKCVSRNELFYNVWGYTYSYKTLSDENLLNSHISVIRRKFKQIDPKLAKCIVTEHGYGYRLGKDYFTKDDE